MLYPYIDESNNEKVFDYNPIEIVATCQLDMYHKKRYFYVTNKLKLRDFRRFLSEIY